MGDAIPYSDDNIEAVYLVGVRVMPHSEAADFHFLVLYYEVTSNDENRPLLVDGDLAIFSRSADADRVLKLGDRTFRKYAPFHGEVAMIYDGGTVLAAIASERDDTAHVAAFLNEALDVLKALRIELPASFREPLIGLADHATFDKDLAALVRPYGKEHLTNAIRWLIGAIVGRVRVV